jgi:hypothetical protein
MPGNLEALLILPEHASGVKRKPLSHKGFCPTSDETTRRHRAGVKGAGGGEANP